MKCCPPGEVDVPLGREAELPEHVEVIAKPAGVIEGEVGEDVVGANVRIEIAEEDVLVLGTEVVLDAADSGVILGRSLGFWLSRH